MVPGDGGKLGFAMLRKDGVEVQYQSRTNLAVDAPGLTNMPSSGPSLAPPIDSVSGT